MKFETIPVLHSQGAILARTLRLPDLVLVKGQRLGAAQLDLLSAAGVQQIAVALVETGDIAEDRAAERVARNLAGRGVIATEANKGRVNLCASAHGLVVFDSTRVRALNHIDEAITIATLPLHDVVTPGQIVATIKVNPYAVPGQIVDAWESAATAFRIATFRSRQTSLIQTLAPVLKDSVLQKTLRVTQRRLEAVGSPLSVAVQADHSEAALTQAIGARIEAGDELILICGASSITDRRDIIPASIVRAGGWIVHFGMPSDPGNLLLLGAVGAVPIVGMPSCARTPQLNGFDYILRLIHADCPVGPAQIMDMGVGGLLRESRLS